MQCITFSEVTHTVNNFFRSPPFSEGLRPKFTHRVSVGIRDGFQDGVRDGFHNGVQALMEQFA